ncbi:hypothetical protein EW146_g5642 [Bondarzewia mesenterica]|uniref:Glutathione S-transferase UstS-like C-terminal domain-containing protein n=1 Tax=Bondarzewia mesenterica TaxID=1095465 RepID=A0A4S4LRV5_9AGAM|nr:hypothetical protein EW146_g5642 [Bondarzewia mesenterica]
MIKQCPAPPVGNKGGLDEEVASGVLVLVQHQLRVHKYVDCWYCIITVHKIRETVRIIITLSQGKCLTEPRSAFPGEYQRASDIADVFKKIGAEHTEVWDGNPKTALHLTLPPQDLPCLHKTYPSAPRIILAGTDAVQQMSTKVLSSKVGRPVFLICGHDGTAATSQSEYFDSHRGKVWKTVTDSFAEVAKWMDANGKGRVFVMGDVPSFADEAIASQIVWKKTVLGMNR